MPVIELMFVSYKTDPELVAELKSKAPEIFTHFSGIQGLKSISRGRILTEDGSAVSPESGRNALVLEWDRSSDFHDFYPKSPQFQSFLGLIKPFIASNIPPQLFESPAGSAPGGSAGITQVIKVKQGSDTEKTWGQIQEAVTKSGASSSQFRHGSGIEDQQGVFVGLIGWESQESYESAQKNSDLTKLVEKLGSDGKISDLVLSLNPVGP